MRFSSSLQPATSRASRAGSPIVRKMRLTCFHCWKTEIMLKRSDIIQAIKHDFIPAADESPYQDDVPPPNGLEDYGLSEDVGSSSNGIAAETAAMPGGRSLGPPLK